MQHSQSADGRSDVAAPDQPVAQQHRADARWTAQQAFSEDTVGKFPDEL